MGWRRWFGLLKIMKTLTKSELETEFGVDRVKELCGGVAGIRGLMACQVKAAKGNAGQDLPAVLDFIGSDATIDRYQETIAASGWKLDNYHKNPVFQNSHKYGDVLFTLGKSLETKVVNDALFHRVEFAVDVNPVAKIAHGLYRGGFLNAVSVGFIPLKWETPSEASNLNTQASGKAQIRRRYLEQELLELSAVAVPANPNALALAIKSGAVDVGDLRDMLDLARGCLDALKSEGRNPKSEGSQMEDLIKEFCSGQAGPDTHAGASGVGAHEAQLLQIAQTAGWVLKRA